MLVIWGFVCSAVIVVADRDSDGANESGTGCSVIRVVDALIIGQCIVGTSVSGGLVVI